ncbi:MAG: hypothetical protein LBC78_05445 [Oscillospiraceae bacterium]|jgi:ABC-type sugar transport system substrate-binding protein|nr:hypothetical protein [Oscillospiraceae bacterium]
MKKALAILLVLCMVFTIVACKPSEGGNTPPPASPSPTPDNSGGDDTPPPPGDKAYPNANDDGTMNADTIAHYDRDFDYTRGGTFSAKVAYLATENSFLYAQSAVAYEHWAPYYGMEWYGFLTAGGDSNVFLDLLQTALDDGVTAFILDPDTTVFPAVRALISKYPEVKWMSQMAPPRDGESGDGIPIGGNLINPYVGFDNFDAGAQQAIKLIEWKKENFPDLPWSEVGFLCFNFSSSPPLAERVIGAREVWLNETGSLDNFFEADAVSTGLNLQGGLDAATPIISTNDQYKHWLVVGLIDDLAQAAASVIATQGLTDTSCVVTFGGSSLQVQWDAGKQDSFRYALFTAQNLYAEPIIGAVYAYLQGWVTPDSIWPSWVKWDDHGVDDHTYSQLRLPTVWLTHETYKDYLEWTDQYAHATAYPYDGEGVNPDPDAFTAIITEVPPEYKQP